MTFKIIPIVTLQMLFICLLLLNCIQNPADIPWGDNQESVTLNNYSNMKFFVRKSSGDLYGASWYYLFKFDTAALAANIPPTDTLSKMMQSSNIVIDTNDNVILLGYTAAYVLYNGSDTLQTFEFNSSERILNAYFSVPGCTNGRIYFSTEFDNDLHGIRMWDGVSVRQIDNVYTKGEVVSIVPKNDTLHVFTSSYYSNRSENHHFYLLNGYQTEVKIAGNDLYLYDVAQIGKHFFTFCRRNTSPNYQYMIGEILKNDSVATLAIIPCEIKRAVKTSDAWYLYEESCDYKSSIYKVTAEGLWMLPVSHSTVITGELFIDSNSRPAFFYTATRLIVHLDSLDGYELVKRW